jgi:hypothetical protein
VTEKRSVRPADMQVRLDGLSLSGRKDFVTAAEAADWMLVAARSELPEAAPQIAMCVTYRGTPGVTVEVLPPLSLMPDISHGRLHLDSAHCERLPGDGWDAYAKPFRTLEDLHVLVALGAWLYGVGCDNAWPQALKLQLLAVLGSGAEVARQGMNDPANHLLLAGVFEQFSRLRGDIDAAMATGMPHWQDLWKRDSSLLEISRSGREKRLQTALASLAG